MVLPAPMVLPARSAPELMAGVSSGGLPCVVGRQLAAYV
jgi:hypothetical protein